jgi:hypothetical protein
LPANSQLIAWPENGIGHAAQVATILARVAGLVAIVDEAPVAWRARAAGDRHRAKPIRVSRLPDRA